MRYTDRPSGRPTMIEVVTGVALAFAILWLCFGTEAKAASVTETQCVYQPGALACRTMTGRVYRQPSARIISIPDTESPDRDAKVRRWIAYCQPTPVIDALGVTRLHYARAGCEFGRDHD